MKKVISYASVFVVGFIACVLALKVMGDPTGIFQNTGSKQAVLTALTTIPPDLRTADDESPVATAAAKLEPSIVAIHVTGHPVHESPFGGDPIFGQMFGSPTVVPRGAGSGVIISSDGYIMTNNHVIADAATVKVHVGPTDGGRDYDAVVVGKDAMTDIAVLKINPGGDDLRPAVLGNSDSIRVGDWAIAVGNPLDIGETVTLGIISAKDRKGSDLEADGSSLYGTRIQTDAAINPGNSGGALADIDGRVIGINEAILSPTGSYIGIGLAIPINDARRIAADLIKDGKVDRPYLGIKYGALKDITEIDARKQMGLPLDTDDGVVVGEVYPNSPASAAGLQQGDLITAADGQKIVDTDSLNDIIQSKSVGQDLSLAVQRKGRDMTVVVHLKERPDNFGVQPDDNGQGPDDGQGQGPDDGQGQDQDQGQGQDPNQNPQFINPFRQMFP